MSDLLMHLVQAFQDAEDEKREKARALDPWERSFVESDTAKWTFSVQDGLPPGTLLISQDVFDSLSRDAKASQMQQEYFDNERYRQRYGRL